MAKVSFSKLGLKLNTEVKSIGYNDIVVKQYLPINEKLELITRVINNAADDNRFLNKIKLEMYLNLEIVFTYTNINFTDKQKEDLPKLYDILNSSGVMSDIINTMEISEYNYLYKNTLDIAEKMYEYSNSIYGILDNIATDYSNLNLDANEIYQKIADPENLALVKDIMAKMG